MATPARDAQAHVYHNDPSSSYTRPPPAYPARWSEEASPLLGPRDSMDNVPDDFKYSTNVAEATIDIRMAFIRKVYAILSVQLAATAIFSSLSFFMPAFKYWIQHNVWMMWISIFGSLVFLGLTFWKHKSYPMNLIFLTGFTAMEAYSISLIVSFYEAPIVIEATLITLGIFVALTLFACQTTYDFTGWMPYLFGLLCGVIVFGFVSVIFPWSNTLELIYSAAVAILFSAYILVDTQLIMRKYHVEEEIGAAINLYLDIINLFLAILRILSSSNND
ncbi:inhibitor of apoptosis-promoting Bax1-domain-containing protein [Kalaharituber pfeilii]|nr:inhibitor of apoptosis-promoting Bax1-domain-containing protein [Kalaharituber pfeilii]